MTGSDLLVRHLFVGTCGAYVGIFLSASGDTDPNADITCNVNICKKS